MKNTIISLIVMCSGCFAFADATITLKPGMSFDGATIGGQKINIECVADQSGRGNLCLCEVGREWRDECFQYGPNECENGRCSRTCSNNMWPKYTAKVVKGAYIDLDSFGSRESCEAFILTASSCK